MPSPPRADDDAPGRFRSGLARGGVLASRHMDALGEELSPNRLTQLVRDYVNAAGTGKKGACHLFRHTMATLMLEGGADIRYIQEMLGHVELSTTQIYTQVSIRKLQAVHALTHPTAKLERRPAAEAQDAGPALVKTAVSADELFAHFAAEDDDAESDNATAPSECGT